MIPSLLTEINLRTTAAPFLSASFQGLRRIRHDDPSSKNSERTEFKSSQDLSVKQGMNVFLKYFIPFAVPGNIYIFVANRFRWIF